MQRDLYHPAVRDYENPAVRVPAHDVVHHGAHSMFERGLVLTAGNDVPVRFLDPPRPLSRIALGDLFARQPFPFAEKDLAEAREGAWFELDRRADDPRGLESAREVARVEARVAVASEARGEQ